ncbi:hypothetical protein COU15_01360 [Candidatus Kaiserbacteria bacterium CG10_big_fil_rev_8_21_14_0_10_45_20]|uniref:HTH arsR-type domain-containing protein n=1 Tax=Candidatus Kaiserbacteria bacterium CG10_big_fil_rev_8_21_14_0_10_45_20 TaxID=1974607 RepID=A0A2H0UG02_9BACT|nr:MAG: hypothetical protein COU15_01360 [Candidatus Kaiserbacteria bacterium CG10_big_fil_rev_8_21_14_0_10_45_20]
MQKLQYKKIERTVRGFANHRRIEILHLLHTKPELSVVEIADTLKINFKTAADHTQRLAITGLIMKRNDGPSVRHKLTKQGSGILKFCRTLE